MEKIDGIRLREFLTRLLGTKGVQGNPTHLDQDSIKTVLDLGHVVAGTTRQLFETGTALFGANAIERQLAARGGAVAFTPLTVETNNSEHYIQALNIRLTYDNAGSTADAGVQLDLQAFYTDGAGNRRGAVTEMRPMFTVAAGFLNYSWCLGQCVAFDGAVNWSPGGIPQVWIPREFGFAFRLERRAGTWPANTFIEIFQTIVEVPAGQILLK